MVKLSSTEFRIKWAGPNVPYIELGNNRYTLTKKDLLLIYKEIGEFMNFYDVDFSTKNINNTLEENEDGSAVD